MTEFVTVAKVSDVPEGSARCVQVHGRRIALYNVNGEYFATDDECTHEEGALSEGEISGDEIVCPLHFATFNIRTGECTGPPGDCDLQTYPVRVDGDDIAIAI